jgi:hypothetical protein
VIFKTDAVVDPRAMMVHLQHTCPAHPTMMASVRLKLRAPFAMATVSRPLRLLMALVCACTQSYDANVMNGWRVLPTAVRNRSGMCQDAFQVTNYKHYSCDIEADCFDRAPFKCRPTME